MTVIIVLCLELSYIVAVVRFLGGGESMYLYRVCLVVG